ncbi:MAG: hypothetical protein E7Z64_02180 [Thermoplasmata archaeon]|jgi:glucose/mannose-6-phosphate isomerase|nr:hypothetical protein [Thermoplasmata archaeon]
MMSDGPSRLLPEHIQESLGFDVPKQEKASMICLFNFEASNIAADTVSSYVFSHSEAQVHTIVDRVVPAWVNESSDVVIMSYSGNSPEIESVYNTASMRGARIHCITSGGKLAELCSGKGHLMLIPKGLNNFEATGYEMGVLVNLYDAMGIEGIKDAMKAAIPGITKYRDEVWGSKKAWRLSLQITDRIPVIYCVGELRAVHKRWKMLINQVLGKLAFSGELPEFDHNEIVSWTEDRNNREFIVLMFRINTDSELLNLIQNTVTELLPEYRLNIKVIDLEGGLMERAIKGIILADAVVDCMKGGE